MITILDAETQFRQFIDSKSFLFIYPIIFLIGVIINLILPQKLFEYLRDNSSIVSSDNFINTHFAYKGNHIFAILFTGVFIINILQEFKSHQTQIHQSNNNNNKLQNEKSKDEELVRLSWQKFKNFTIKFTLKIFILFLLFYIIDHIFILTGGSCIIDKAVTNILAKSSKSLEQCTEYNGTWVKLNQGFCLITPEQISRKIASAQICYKYGEWEGGFDISGHFCFITTLSLILWYELKELNESYFENDLENDLESQKIGVEDGSWFKFTVTNVVRWIVLGCLILWIELLLVTAIFYHTTLEKLLGLILGYVGPFIFYHLLPNIPFLHSFIY
ncbi:putative membrane protein [Wickerhamomyces ciferrii]|uniref:Membrane protein n=1 Tax=Wickerhamomyces ciferrii (strain ATCC 14091 / BCRC 22168 / CBS 111 / JCM 3599 / NBRC 0793 / NRRL Y-1031 F-60-10) TaxID=1206466 RepID=K0KKN4_WICCF|nr:uncharacterized protein BN7_1219 [Wickerhamomyces ciferrii]CCH41678.1 putative membrane protein [Wickerhamomyces ciferrii]